VEPLGPGSAALRFATGPAYDRRVQDVAGILAALDEPTARMAASAVTQLLGDPDDPSAFERLCQLDVQEYLWRELPGEPATGRTAHHDVAWALADVLELAGRPRYAALCRDRVTHEILEAWRRDPAAGAAAATVAEQRSGVVPPETETMTLRPDHGSGLERLVRHQASRMLELAVERGELSPGGPDSQRDAERLVDAFLRTPSAAHQGDSPRDALRRDRARAWASRLAGGDRAWIGSVLPAVLREPEDPSAPELSLAPARALLEAVADGVHLTPDGELPAATVVALDDRFAWSDDRPRTRRGRAESRLPPLLFLRQHLQAQGLLTVRQGRLGPSTAGRRCIAEPSHLWRAVVGPAPRWDGVDADVLAVQAGLLLRSPAISREELVDETAAVTGMSRRPMEDGSVAAAVDWVRVEWYRVGVALGWWERSRGRWLGLRLSRLGRAAAAETFWSVVARPASG
jgi:hypothetical protein